MSDEGLRQKGGTRRAATALAVFARLDDAGIPYSILRNHDLIPSDPGRDVDLVVSPASLDRFGAIAADVGGSLGWDVVCACRGHHEGASFYFLALGPDHNPIEQLELHCTLVRWAGVRVFDEATILARRTRSANGLWVNSDVDQAAQLTLQHVLSGRFVNLKPVYRELLDRSLRESPTELAEAFALATGDRQLADELVRAIEAGDPAGLRDRVRRAVVRQAMRAGGRVEVLSQAMEFARHKVAMQLLPRCGVVARLPEEEAAALETRVRSLAEKVFLEITSYPDGERASGRRAAGNANRAGLSLLTGSGSPGRGATGRKWRKAIELRETMSDRELKAAIVNAFVGGHRRLHAEDSFGTDEREGARA